MLFNSYEFIFLFVPVTLVVFLSLRGAFPAISLQLAISSMLDFLFPI